MKDRKRLKDHLKKDDQNTFWIGGTTLINHPRCSILPKSEIINLLALWTSFMEDNFFHGLEGGWFWDDSNTLYLLYTLFHYYYNVLYNEVIIQLIIMQNKWELWACFSVIRLSHLGMMGDSETQRGLLMSSLLQNIILVIVTAENSASQTQDVENWSRLFSAFVAISG